METKRLVGSFVNVILTRQTCGHHSSRTAESKRQALGSYLSERICYMFLISKCRGDRDLGLCTTSVLAFGEPRRSGDFRKKTCFDAGKIGFCHCDFSLQSGKVCSTKLERIFPSINFSSEFWRIHAKETQKLFGPTKAKCCKLVV